ncbi:hypothetical protein ACBY01_04755 [Sphingomonas sp. ac-8]
MFALWCMGVAAAFLLAISFAWSPFADSGRAGPRGVLVTGPTHK